MPKQPKKSEPKPVGRPRLAKGDAKEAMLRIRATPREVEAYDRVAAAKGSSRSDWIRSVLNAAI